MSILFSFIGLYAISISESCPTKSTTICTTTTTDTFIDVATNPSGACFQQVQGLDTVTVSCASLSKCNELCAASEACMAFGYDRNILTCTVYNNMLCEPINPKCNGDPNVHMRKKGTLPKCNADAIIECKA